MKRDNEKELDELFRLGLDNPAENNTFLSEDWDAMEAMLDKDKKRRGLVYLLPVLSGIAALLLLTFGWFFLTDKKQDGVAKLNPVKKPAVIDQVNKAAKTEQPAVTLQPDLLPQASAKQTTKQPAINFGGNTYFKEKVQSQKVIVPQTVIPVYADTDKPKVTTLAFNNDGAVRVTTDSTAIGLKPKQASINVLAANIVQADSYQAQQNAIIAEGRREDSLSHINAKGKPSIIKADSFKPVFAITIMGSPDLNGVGSSFNDTKTGVNAGVAFSVSVTKRFTVSTGAVYSKKPYVTDFSNYHTSFVFKTQPEYVTADCRVLDIPLNIDYQIISKGANKFSVGTGLSSYFMLRENYHFDYDNAAVSSSDYNIANKNRHLFGVLNLSATYQRKLNDKLGLNVQPYYKLPLTQIGYGKVNLQSSGVALGFSWALNTKK